jgi:hypothetical protein
MKSFAMPARPATSSSRGRRHLSVATILDQVVAPALVRSRAPKDVQLRMPQDVKTRGTSVTDLFEARVFRFLVTHYRELGLREVWRFNNQLIDGALVLSNGMRVALEVKYQLGWDTACRSNCRSSGFSDAIRENGATTAPDWSSSAPLAGTGRDDGAAWPQAGISGIGGMPASTGARSRSASLNSPTARCFSPHGLRCEPLTSRASRRGSSQTSAGTASVMKMKKYEVDARPLRRG